MADKIEYSRMLVKRTDQTGEVPTVPPITAVTLNQFIPTDLFVGEFFLNEVDDLLWVRTSNGILPISLSGSTGTTVPNLTQVLFQGNATNGYNIDVSVGDTIIFQGLTTGSTTQFLGIDTSGNTIVSGVMPGTPDLQSVLFQGNTTNGNDIEVSSGDTIVFDGLTTGSTTNILGIDNSGNTIVTSVSSGVGLYLPLSGGTVTGNTKFTQDFYLTNLTSGGSQTFLTVDSDTGQVYTGSLNPFVGNIQIQGQSWVKLPTTGNTTSSTTINWNDGNTQEKVLNVSATTFTFSNPNAGGTYILILRQRSSGGGTVTWPGTVSWAGGTPPTMTTTANKYDVYTFVFDGSKYFGSYIQDFT
jgi:hypothetical protein